MDYFMEHLMYFMGLYDYPIAIDGEIIYENLLVFGFSCIILLVVISSVFRFLMCLVKGR